MVSAWDDWLDDLIRTHLHITKESLSDKAWRAIVSTLFALAVLGIFKIDVDDLFGTVIHS